MLPATVRAHSCVTLPALRVTSKVNLQRCNARTPTEQTKRTSNDAADSAEQYSAELTDQTEKLVADLKEKWDKLEEKPAAIAITVAALVALYALNGVVNAVDSIPIVSGGLELVGLFVTAWFVYRYLIFGPDREELKENLQSFWAKVSGK